MVLKALLFSVFQFILLAIVSLIMAGIIKLIFKAVHRREAQKPAIAGKEGAK